MRCRFKTRHGQRGATIIMLMLMVPLVLLPLVGLAIDATRIYIVQSKLSAAVDGAALGAGRLLGTNANTTEIAGEFLHANFPEGYWSTNNLTPNITFSNNLGSQKITVAASVNVPLTFIRVLGFSQSQISAAAVATRAVTRVIMVLDRSGSMDNTDPVTGKNVFDTMKAGAQWFASRFTPGYDELGVVMFSGSGIVAYPKNWPWDPSPTGAGGPDKSFATDPQNQVGPIFDQLSAMDVGGGTNMSEALTMAYVEMQKAHNRDLAANGSDNVLNTIVLFTDGVPSAMSVYLNDPTPGQTAIKLFGNNTSTQSKCNNVTANAGDATTQMKGWLAVPGAPPTWSYTVGLYQNARTDPNHNLSWWVGSQNGSMFQLANSNPLSGCKWLDNPNSAIHNSTNITLDTTSSKVNYNAYLPDMKKVPDFDMYGNATTGAAYQNSVLVSGTHTSHPNTASYDPNTPLTGYNLAAGMWNATDSIGKAIRAQTAMSQIQIFCIGYTGNSPGTDSGLLLRLSNASSDSSSWDPTQPIGKFYLVNDANQLSAAFDAVASSLLRLAQ